MRTGIRVCLLVVLILSTLSGCVAPRIGIVRVGLDSKGFPVIAPTEQALSEAMTKVNARADYWQKYIFPAGEFPEFIWENQPMVGDSAVPLAMSVRWFDSELNEVTKADKPGRYAALIEGVSPEGLRIRRAYTFYCRDPELHIWAIRTKAHVDSIANISLKEKTFKRHEGALSNFAGAKVADAILNDPDGAVLLAFLKEEDASDATWAKFKDPIIRDMEYQLALKRKILDVEERYPGLAPPRNLKGLTAPVIRDGSAEEAGVKPDTTERIRALCQEWHNETQEPFSVLVARHGVRIINESFGPVERDTQMYMASLTKLLTAVMFAQFIDQGLVEAHAPVGKYLPGMPVEGDKAITVHQCFTHTHGIEYEAGWQGVYEPWLESNVVMHLTNAMQGKRYKYSGIGYDLAGKIMEMTSGKSAFRLFRENLFDPLNMDNTTLTGSLGGSATSTAEDWARIGQLLLNKGSYGDLQFFTPETLEVMGPQPLEKFYPGVQSGVNENHPRHEMYMTAGMGLHLHNWEKDPETGKRILGKNTIGHGASTGAILRVDYDNDLVIVVTRNRPAGGEYKIKLYRAIVEGIEN